jgi:hypothetical protein
LLSLFAVFPGELGGGLPPLHSRVVVGVGLGGLGQDALPLWGARCAAGPVVGVRQARRPRLSIFVRYTFSLTVALELRTLYRFGLLAVLMIHWFEQL